MVGWCILPIDTEGQSSNEHSSDLGPRVSETATTLFSTRLVLYRCV